MKRIVFALTILVSLALRAQNTASPTVSPATKTSPAAPTGGTTRSPANPAQTGPFALRVQSPTNAVAGAGLTNQFGTNVIAGNLGSALLVLQNNLQQALPLLAAFNSNSNASIQEINALGQTLGSSGPANSAVNNGVNFGANNGVNFAQNNGVNFGQNNGVNFATSVATPTTTVSPAATPPSVFAQPTNSPVPPTALAPPPTASDVVGSASTTINTVPGSVPAGGSTQLLILQNDIARLLAEISAVTGVGFSTMGNGAFVTNNPGVINNANLTASQLGTTVDNATNTGTPRILTRPTAPRTLTPTGR